MRRLTNEEFAKKVFEKHGGEIEVLDRYVTQKHRLRFKHICGHIWDAKPNNIAFLGRGCPLCRGTFKKTQEQYANELTKKHNGDIVVVGEYKTAKTGILHKHLICGHEWEATPDSILRGNGCPKCRPQKPRKTHEKYITEVYEKHGNEIEVLGKYEKDNVKIIHKHTKCGYEWSAAPSLILQGRGCPKCAESRGEKVIRLFLKERCATFRGQYKFDDCKNVFPLSFDFAIFNNEQLAFLIEYDGEQHFNPTGFWGGKEKLKATKFRDSIKTKYCIDHNISLLRLPYWLTNEEVKAQIDDMLIKARTSAMTKTTLI